MYVQFFLATLCCFSSTLLAFSLEEVDYEIPKNLTTWSILNESKGNKGSARVYGPPQSGPFDPLEIYGVSANDQPNSALDEASLRESVQALFPGLTVESKILEQQPHSVTFEWRVIEEGQTVLFGLSRVLTSDKGTALFSYQTEIPEKIATAEKEWLPVIKAAKLKDKEEAEQKPQLKPLSKP